MLNDKGPPPPVLSSLDQLLLRGRRLRQSCESEDARPGRQRGRLAGNRQRYRNVRGRVGAIANLNAAGVVSRGHRAGVRAHDQARGSGSGGLFDGEPSGRGRVRRTAIDCDREIRRRPSTRKHDDALGDGRIAGLQGGEGKIGGRDFEQRRSGRDNGDGKLLGGGVVGAIGHSDQE